MKLDVLTLSAMGSFVSACAGAVLIIAWSQNRKISTLALWGLANIATALGILALVLRSTLNHPAWSLLGVILLTVAPGLLWKAARAFDAKPAPLGVALLGAAVAGLACLIPDLPGVGGFLNLTAAAAYMIAVAVSFWLSRRERLAARWPIIVLASVHAAVLSLGAYATASGDLGGGILPPVMSLFGLVHFENIIFTLGTAVFILALVKERNEAASRNAARSDPLTGVANRLAFMESAERTMERCRRENAPVSVVMCDLDRFKTINDTHGHSVGDAVIKMFCQVATAALRPNDAFGRVGGEEFAILLPRSSIEAACVRAERIRVAFAESGRYVGNLRIDATVSCGVSASSSGKETLGLLLEQSDAALYDAKADGRNRVKRAARPAPEDRSSPVIRVA